jgi:hypothetical protein
MHTSPPNSTPPVKASSARPPSIRYLGFECTSEGRRYRLSVDGPGEPRVFTVLIANAAFLARQARFQDAPELCVAHIQRELDSNAELQGGGSFVITPAELDQYRDAQLKKSPDRKTRTQRTWP